MSLPDLQTPNPERYKLSPASKAIIAAGLVLGTVAGGAATELLLHLPVLSPIFNDTSAFGWHALFDFLGSSFGFMGGFVGGVLVAARREDPEGFRKGKEKFKAALLRRKQS